MSSPSSARSRFWHTLIIGVLTVGVVALFLRSIDLREALQAVDYLMDRLKTEAPFWKKEVRPEGAEWIEPRADDREAHARWINKE